MQTTFIVVGEKLSEYQNEIDRFVGSLSTEKKYLNINFQRVMNSRLVILAMGNHSIVGLGGLEKKRGLARSYIVVKKEHQNQFIGAPLFMKILKEAKKKHSIIMGAVEKENIKALKMFLSKGYKHVGEKKRLMYICKPFNASGYLIYLFIKAVFPLYRLLAKPNR